MKKFVKKYLLAMILILGSATMFTSCDEKLMEDIAESVNLVGTWQCSETVHSSVSPSDIRPTFDGYITFRADHTFTDNYGFSGNWYLKNRTVTLDYNSRYKGRVQLLVQEGYTTKRMVLTTNIDLGYGRSCFSTVTLNAR